MTGHPDWSHNVTEIPERGLNTSRSASASDLAELGDILELLSLDKLSATYRIEPLRQGRYLLAGTVDADVTQTCVVTLEPLKSHVHEAFEVEFWPTDQMETADGQSSEEEVDPEARDVEPIEDGRIAVGRIVAETLATAIDPYPRKPDASFDWTDEKARADGNPNPFAVLAKLKDDAASKKPKG